MKKQVNKKKSISKKLNLLLAMSLIALSFFMIAVNMLIVYKTTTRNSEIMMKKTCNSQALELNNQFGLVEQSVKNMYDISECFRPSLEQLGNKKMVDAYIKQFRETAITIADNTKGALAIYYRMNPDITLSGTTGFFYVRSSITGKLEENEITDLYKYDVDDMEHVGWYYVPVWAGKAVWMDPYYNANIDVEMISYVMPIYDKNNLLGVVGIDVDFNAIKATAENIDIYNTCGGILCSMSNGSIYYNNCDTFGSEISEDLNKILQKEEEAQEIINYKTDKGRYGIYYQTLNNRMKYLIYAEKAEIFSQSQSTMMISVLVFLIVYSVTLLISLRMGRRIVKPIIEITDATKQYAKGDWDTKVSCDTQDELEVLTENISIMADKTKEYIRYIQDMAKKDGLTGLRNKTDYLIYVDKVKTDYIPNTRRFAIVVFDVNNLKKVNDTLGHEKGDELIVNASQYICKSYAHSPVFRIGGDEFVAILDGADYNTRMEIMDSFHKHMQAVKDSQEIMEVCIASGMAVFEEDGANYEAVFEMADQRMYENKLKLKNGTIPR